MDNTEELAVQYKYIDRVKQLLTDRYDDKTIFAHIHSYGCLQNVSDGEKMMGMLALMGFSFCDSPDDANLVIYNTCAVRENAELKLWGNVGELKHKKNRDPNTIVGLCGCMMQQSHIVDKVKASYPFVDMVFGTHVIGKLPEFVFRALSENNRIIDIDNSNNDIVDGFPTRRDKNYKASIPIMYGCNNFCTYCVVPYVRGRERSRTSRDVVVEFTSLIKNGCKEITLLGQNVNSYGKGLDEEINFSKLLRILNDIPGDFRIRFMSSHPKDATFELIDTIADCEKVCNHFHLPVQSGSDRILEQMNRNYTARSYMKLIDYARKAIPNIAFTSDVIVGFPGETYEDFCDTVSLVKQVRFDSIFSFIYSKRVGTRAYEMEDSIPASKKLEWFQQLLATQREIGKGKYKSCVGDIYRVLVDGEGKTGESYLTGRNDGYMIVDFVGDKNLIGTFVNVKITKALNWALLGEII